MNTLEADPQALAAARDVGEDRFHRGGAERFDIGRVLERVAALVLERTRDIADILALVAVLGQRRVDSQLLQIAHAHRLAEQLHLAPAVVEVVLARHLEAGRLEHARDRVTEHRVAAVADGERSGGIGGQELDLHAPRTAGAQLPFLRAEIFRAACERRAHLAMPVLRRHPEVDKPGARDRDLADFGGQLQMGANRVGDFARRLPLSPRHRERHVARDIAVRGILGSLGRDRGGRGFEQARGARTLDRGAQAGDYDFFHLAIRRKFAPRLSNRAR